MVAVVDRQRRAAGRDRSGSARRPAPPPPISSHRDPGVAPARRRRTGPASPAPINRHFRDQLNASARATPRDDPQQRRLADARRAGAAASSPAPRMRRSSLRIDRLHQPGRDQMAARPLRDRIACASRVMLVRDRREPSRRRRRCADRRPPRAASVERQCPPRSSASRRQIEPADRRILVDVAQDVGELQRAAEMMAPARCPAPPSMPNTRTDSRPTAEATRSQ